MENNNNRSSAHHKSNTYICPILPNKNPHISKNHEIKQATWLQKLYRDNMKAACREVTELPSPGCCISHEKIINYFSIPSAPSIPQITDNTDISGPSFNFLETPFSPAELWNKLKGQNNTSPGPDKIRYKHWKNLTLMALYSLLYSINVELQLVHSSWKTSRTILLHKDGDLKEPSNWRPIALIDTTARLFTSCLATRLLFIIQKHSILSPEQKGFLPGSWILQHSKSNKKHLAAAWLDIKNASGSTPHVD